jgi:hypothetical protein
MFTNTKNLYTHFFLLGLIFIAFPSIGQCETEKLRPGYAYQMVELVHSEIELIRKHKQASIDSRDSIPIENAYPREVYFQALTLRQKAGRLCHETAQYLLAPPTVVQFSIPKTITSKDVYEIVNDAWSQIRCAKAGLKISDFTEQNTKLDPTKTFTDVFKSIVQANRQLNLILEQPIEQGDVYAMVQLSNAYTVDILDKLAPVWNLTAPTLPDVQTDKTPIDIYKLMIKNFRIIQQIANDSGIDMLHLGSEIQTPITSTDVFDLSSLILSELRYFASQVGIDRIYRLKSYPGKVPSEVYQQALIVEAHLQILEGFTKTYPTWTKIE